MSASIHIDLRRAACAHGSLGSGHPSKQPLFFYHVPRTGGISFFHSLQCAMLASSRCAKAAAGPSKEPNILRIDTPPDARAIRGGPYAFIASHEPYGCHRLFRQSFRLTTILRDPVDRVKSHFTYHCMRAGLPATEAAFLAAISAEENTDCMVKQLTGHHPSQPAADPALWQRAIESLETTFDTFTISGNIRPLLEHYLSQYHLSNIISERINATQPAYRLATAHLDAAVAERNAQDVRLFHHVRDHPRLPPRPAGALHPLTTIVYETENAARFSGGFTAVATADLFSAMGEPLTPDATLDRVLSSPLAGP